MIKRLTVSPLIFGCILFFFLISISQARISGTVTLTDAWYVDIGLSYPPLTPRIYVEVFDPDRNMDIDSRDTLGVIFTTEHENDFEYVVLNENGNNSGVFRGYIPVDVIPFLLPRPAEEELNQKMLELSSAPGYIQPSSEIPGSDSWLRQSAEFSLMSEISENATGLEQFQNSRLDELGVLELTSGCSIVCSYPDPVNDWGYEEVISDAAIYGGYAGDISNQTWTAQNGPYVIVGDVYSHDPENPLTVGPGVHIQFTGDFWFQASSVEVNGAEGDSIYFEAHPDFDPQRWVYIIGFNNDDINYVVFQGSCRGSIGSANHCRFSNHYFFEAAGCYDSCLFSDNQPNGLPQFSHPDITINNCEFSDNLGSGCVLGSQAIQISNSVFRFNSGHGLFLNTPSTTISITNSRFSENWYTGIYIHSAGLGSEITINDCDIFDNSSGYDVYNTSFIDINAQSNNWGQETTDEMNAGENPQNISAIYDEFDESGRGRVDYSDYIGNSNPGVAAELHFTNSVFQAVDNYPLTISNVYVELIDDDANSNPEIPDTVGIILGSSLELDFEYLVLTETEASSNTFHGSMPVDRQTLQYYDPDPGEVDRMMMSLKEEFPEIDDELLKEIAVSRVRERMYSENRLWDFSRSSLDEIGILEVFGGDVITAVYPASSDDSVHAQICFGGISGTISNQILTEANSPYVVSGDVFAENLVIQPGVEILFYDDFSFTTTGTFLCQGTQTDSIVFRSHPDYQGSMNEPWIFEPSLNSDPIDYIVCKNNGLVIVSYQLTFLNSRFTNIDTYNRGTISSSIINNSPHQNAINMHYGTVENSTIENCSGNGISSIMSFEIHDVIIRNNGGYGIKLTGSNTSGGIDGCTIIGNQAGGIYTQITYGYPIIHENEMYNNGFAYDFFNESDLDIDARYNYWGPETTAEMDASSGLVNISRIYDHFDDQEASTVDYIGYTGSSFSGIRGIVKLTNLVWYDIGAHYTLDATTAYAEVVDPDRNTNNLEVDTLGVTFSTESEMDNEYIIMTETGENTGIFHGSIPLNVLETPQAASLDELGELEVVVGDAITCSYLDPLSYWDEVEVIRDHAIYGGIEGLVGNQVWTPDNNPYIIVGDCYSTHEAHLIVEAGVEILFAAAAAFDGIMNEFNGTESDSIKIGIHPAFYNDWSTLNAPVWDDGYLNQYTYTVFDSLYQMKINNSDYTHCRMSHVNTIRTESNTLIDSCLISENEYGIFLYFCDYFTNNHVVNNRLRGVGLRSCTNFDNNIIEGNAAYGISQNGMATGETCLITNCVIRNNDGYGITNNYPMNGQLIVNNCDLYGHTSGFDIYLNNSPGPVDVRFNFWGEERTALLYNGAHPRSLENIYDYFNDPNLGTVNYSNWRNHSITESPNHFMPPPGNGNFNILITGAFHESVLLGEGDEIAVIDDYEGENICVGAVTIPEDFTWEEYLSLRAVRRVDTGDQNIPGYTSGNQIYYRFYDSSEDTEFTAYGTYEPGFEDLYGYGSGTIVSLSTEGTGLEENTPKPERFEVFKPYPNPTNSSFVISFTLPEQGIMSYVLYNVLGQVVIREKQQYPAGQHKINMNYDPELVSGVYFIEVKYMGQSRTQKVLYLK